MALKLIDNSGFPLANTYILGEYDIKECGYKFIDKSYFLGYYDGENYRHYLTKQIILTNHIKSWKYIWFFDKEGRPKNRYGEIMLNEKFLFVK